MDTPKFERMYTTHTNGFAAGVHGLQKTLFHIQIKVGITRKEALNDNQNF